MFLFLFLFLFRLKIQFSLVYCSPIDWLTTQFLSPQLLNQIKHPEEWNRRVIEDGGGSFGLLRPRLMPSDKFLGECICVIYYTHAWNALKPKADSRGPHLCSSSFFFYVQVQVSSRVSVSFGSRRIPPTHPVRFHFQRSFSQELWAAQKEVLTPWFAWFPPRIYLLTHQPGCCCCSRLSDRVEINKKDKRNLSNYSYPEKINKAFIYLTEWIAFQLNIHLGILQCRLPGCFWYRKTKQRQQ